jgi:hypothetical protein
MLKVSNEIVILSEPRHTYNCNNRGTWIGSDNMIISCAFYIPEDGQMVGRNTSEFAVYVSYF